MEIGGVVQLIGALVGVVAAGYKAYTEWRKAQSAQAGMDATVQALNAVIAALELMPASDPRVMKAKLVIRQVAEQVGAEQETLARAVDDVKAILREMGFDPLADETDPAQVERAAQAVEALRARRRAQPSPEASAGKPPSPSAPAGERGRPLTTALRVVGPLVMVGLLAWGCARPEERLTREMVWPGQSGEPDSLVVEWPRGVRAADVVSIDAISSDGEMRAQSGADLPALTSGTVLLEKARWTATRTNTD